MEFSALRKLVVLNRKKHAKKSSAPRGFARRFTSTFDLLEDRRVLSATWWVGSDNANFADINAMISSPLVLRRRRDDVEPGTYDNASLPGSRCRSPNR